MPKRCDGLTDSPAWAQNRSCCGAGRERSVLVGRFCQLKRRTLSFRPERSGVEESSLGYQAALVLGQPFAPNRGRFGSHCGQGGIVFERRFLRSGRRPPVEMTQGPHSPNSTNRRETHFGGGLGACGPFLRNLRPGRNWEFTNWGLVGIIARFGSVRFRHWHAMPI